MKKNVAFFVFILVDFNRPHNNVFYVSYQADLLESRWISKI